MSKSRDANSVFGVYQSDCCELEIVIGVGVEFPTCPKHPYRRTFWTAIEIQDNTAAENARKRAMEAKANLDTRTEEHGRDGSNGEAAA